jgi:hypothetical protein
MTYYFEYTGPPISAPGIPLIFSISGYTAASASGGSEPLAQSLAEISVNGGGAGSSLTGYSCSATFTGFCSSGEPPITQTSVFNILPNSMVTIDLAVSASAVGVGSGSLAGASAYADPYFYIDPTFPLADEYTLVISTGVGDSPLAPIPESSSLALLGIAALGVIATRRLQKLD